MKSLIKSRILLSSVTTTPPSPAKIALVEEALEIRSPETEAKISISMPDQLQSFLNHEDEILKKKVESIKSVGANVLFAQRGVDDLVSFYLAKELLKYNDLNPSDIYFNLGYNNLSNFSIAFKNKFALCGYKFSLKGSQAALGKSAFYSPLVEY